MERVAEKLAVLGLPDRWGLVAGIRTKVAAMLVDQARAMGPAAFRAAAADLVETILQEVRHDHPGSGT